ncbi:hypothetical protein [uncultured Tateyamaria sp.]|uniref:hypothetical protein n=1 Tax=uncultured Tateyamaria sp. TaxID=455651 RepID=UPI002625C7F5|nr:hypothetical protein [uncultured Tateyamaria sp.]
MSIAAIAQGAAIIGSLVSTLNQVTSMFKSEDKVKHTYGSGVSITNLTDYDFHQVQFTGNILDEDGDRNDRANWFDAPENTLKAQHLLTAGFKGHYDEDEEVIAETCLAYYSPTSPVDGLGMLVFLWLDTYRDDDEDDLVEYRCAAYSTFAESELRKAKDGTPLDKSISEFFHKKRKLFLKKGMTYEPPIFNTFGYSIGQNVRAKSYLNSHIGKVHRVINDDNFEIRVSMVAGQHTAFEIMIKPVGKGFASPFGHD